jgi:hypothetical protein
VSRLGVVDRVIAAPCDPAQQRQAPTSLEAPVPRVPPRRPLDAGTDPAEDDQAAGRRRGRHGRIGLVLLAVYLLCPKVPLRGGAGYLSEFRIEDVITVVAAVWLVASGRLGRTPVARPVGWYLGFLWVYVLSAVLNASAIGLQGLVFSARLVEYLVWFGVGWVIATEAREDAVERVATLVAVVLVCWAVLELVGAIPQVGRFIGTKGRISLNPNGPYEAAAVVLLLAMVVRARAVRIALAVVVLLTQARITLVAGLMAGATFARGRRRLHRLVPGLVLLAAVAVGLVVLFPSNRLRETPTPPQMVETLVSTWSRVPIVSSHSQFVSETEFGQNLFHYIPGKVDLSFEVRAVRWATVVKSTTSDVEGLVFGRGPSAWGIGVDGYYVRLIGESGLVGLLMFVAFALVAMRRYGRDSLTRVAMVSLLVTAVFIDIFVSSKAMPLLWVFVAWDEARLRQRRT